MARLCRYQQHTKGIRLASFVLVFFSYGETTVDNIIQDVLHLSREEKHSGYTHISTGKFRVFPDRQDIACFNRRGTISNSVSSQIPQSTVLGLLRFIIYINVIKRNIIRIFVDYSKIQKVSNE